MTPSQPAMNAEQDRVRSEALDWLVKTGDPGFDQWDRFTQWLEQSPDHADAYHWLAAGLADADGLLTDVRVAEPEVAPVQPRRHMRLAFAASVAVLAAAGAVMLSPLLTTDDYATAPGQMRTIALEDGNRLILNGDTKVTLAGLNRDEIRLEKGQLFLKLDGKPRVAVTSGDLRFVDIGTVFEVSRSGSETRLVVSEGAVMADPDGARVKVGAGQMLETHDGDDTLGVQPASTAAGGWVNGQLNYSDAPISQVLDDLHRSTGLVFSTSPAMSAGRFSGTLSAKDIRNDPETLGPLLGVSVKRSGDKWLVEGGS